MAEERFGAPHAIATARSGGVHEAGSPFDILGAFRRRISITSRRSASTSEARAVLLDDFHHFRVALKLSEDIVTEVRVEALRYPFSTCPMAATELKPLKGATRAKAARYLHTNTRLHCTHMLDLALLAVANEARHTAHRIYEVVVPDWTNGSTKGFLWRDSRLVFEWNVAGDRILQPQLFGGVGYLAGFNDWVKRMLPDELAEAALVLRRALVISHGRDLNLDDFTHAPSTGHCFAQQQIRALEGKRISGSTLNRHADAEAFSEEHDRAWLAFE